MYIPPSEVIRVIPRSFLNLNFTGAQSNNTELFLATHVDVSRWREVTLYVRQFPNSSITGTWTTTPTINVYCDGWTSEDPGTGYYLAPPGQTNTLALSTSAPASGTGTLQALNGLTNLGSMIHITLSMKASANATCAIWLGVDVSGKS